MTILQEILRWSKTIPAWQSDAVARLLSKQSLDEQDLDDLYALLKVAHGIADETGRTARPLAEDQIPVPVASTTKVVLQAITNLQNVNAIASTVRVPIAPTGLTVIYGDNGSGKSGYSRVLRVFEVIRNQSVLHRRRSLNASCRAVDWDRCRSYCYCGSNHPVDGSRLRRALAAPACARSQKPFAASLPCGRRGWRLPSALPTPRYVARRECPSWPSSALNPANARCSGSAGVRPLPIA